MEGDDASENSTVTLVKGAEASEDAGPLMPEDSFNSNTIVFSDANFPRFMSADSESNVESIFFENKLLQTELCSSDISKMEDIVQKYYSAYYIKSKNLEDKTTFFGLSNFSSDNDKVKYFTGLPNFTVLNVIFHFVKDHIAGGKVLTLFEEFVLVLTKLKLNIGLQALAYLANISVSTVSRLLLKWLVVLDYRLTPACIIWPDREALQKTMPFCFRSAFGTKVTVIIDCFEIFIDRPSNLLTRAETWSQYKHHNTTKYLIGITPQGAISFISKGWGGRVSDKYLTEHSGLLDKLMYGNLILADRGFTVSESVVMAGAQLQMPAFTKGRDQLTAVEVDKSRTLSNVRIHVERVIGLIRQKYAVLNGPIAIDFLTSRSGEIIPLVDRMVRVCCSLSNLCESVVPFY